MLSKYDRAALAFGLESLETRRLLAITVAVTSAHVMNITGTTGNDTITVNGLSNGKVSVNGGTQFAPGTGSGQFNQIFVNAGNGNDAVSINNNFTYLSSTISGSGGNDTLTGGKGNDSIDGDNDNDTLDGGGAGADLLRGDLGFDTANYSTRTDNLTISLDTTANDGSGGGTEKDNVQTEEVIAGSGNDTLTGSAGDDFFTGGAGADTIDGKGGNDDITGSTGKDILLGNTGGDFIQAQNSDVDQVSGGPNTDTALDFASVDSVDIPAAITSLPAAAPLVRQSLSLNPNAVVNPGPLPSDLDTTYGVNGQQTGPNFGLSNIATAIDSQGRAVFAGVGQGDGGSFIEVTRYTVDGQYDRSFGIEGAAEVDFTPDGSSSDEVNSVVIGPGDSIVIVGSTTGNDQNTSDIAVAKLTSGGLLDGNFGLNGVATIDLSDSIGGSSSEVGDDAVFDSLGRLDIAAEKFRPIIASIVPATAVPTDDSFVAMRLTATGGLDSSFNGIGWTSVDVGFDASVTSIALQSLPADAGFQRIILGGSADDKYALARFTNTGALDTSFAAGVGFTKDGPDLSNSLNDVVVGPDNTIYGAGQGTIDESTQRGTQSSWSADGVFQGLNTYSTGAGVSYQSLFVDSQGRILDVGAASGEYFIVRTSSTGFDFLPVLDGFFGDDNQPADDVALACRTTADGKIVVSGSSTTNGGDTFFPSALRLLGDGAVQTPPPTQIPDIEVKVTDADIQNPPPALKALLVNLTPSAMTEVKMQPDVNGNSVVNLGSGNDLVVLHEMVNPADGLKILNVTINGVTHSLPATLHKLTINTGAGNDSVESDKTVDINLDVDLGADNDYYQGGAEKAVVLGGTGDDLLLGGSSGNCLVGGAGVDILFSGTANDILIGGTQFDILYGGNGQDVLIAGTTSYDTNFTALRALIDAWRPNTPAFATRVTQLQTGVGTPSVFLKTGTGGTVFADNSHDLLIGGFGKDWIFH